jgi:hypothetical protein
LAASFIFKPSNSSSWIGLHGVAQDHQADEVRFAILDDIDMDQCTNEWLLEPESSGNVDPQKSLWSKDHAHL